jgi:hypothetical protein
MLGRKPISAQSGHVTNKRIVVTGEGVRQGRLTSMILLRWKRVERLWLGTSMVGRTDNSKSSFLSRDTTELMPMMMMMMMMILIYVRGTSRRV